MEHLKAAYLMNEGSASAGETKSSRINELIALVTEIRTGKVPPEELVDELDNLKFTINTIKGASFNLRPVQPGIDGAEDKYDHLIELFDLLILEFDQMALYIDERDDKFLDGPLENIKKYIDEVMDISEGFKKAEDDQPVYSKFEFVSDLIRVGKGYAEGKYELEPLINRHNLVRDLMLQVRADMEPYGDLPKDTKALENNYSKAIEAVDSSISALDSMEALFESDNVDRKEILPLLDIIQESCEEMYVIQQKIEKEIEQMAEKSSMRTCPRCGKNTSISEKHCVNCNAVLPPLPEGKAIPQSEISVIEGPELKQASQDADNQQALQGQKLVSPNILKIYESALKVGRGEITKEDFGAVIKWYENIVAKTRKELASIKEPENESEENMQIFHETFSLLKAGIDGSQAGLDELKLYFDDENLDHLVNGVNMIMDAGDKLYQAQTSK